MKNKEKQTKDAAKNPKQQVQIKPAGKNLSEADLDKVAGGGAYSTTRRPPSGI
jgi:hypothetical protein